MNTKAKNISSWIMSYLIVGCVGAAYGQSNSGQAAPQWKVGDSWRVGAWHGQVFKPEYRAQTGTYKLKGRMVSVTFQVTGTETVKGTDCNVVKVTFPAEETGFQRLYQVYYAKDTNRLVRVRDVSVRTDGSTKDIATDYPAGNQGPTFVDDVSSLVPLDWPNLAQQNVSPQPVGAAGSTAQTTTTISVQSTDGKTHTEDEVDLTKSSPQKQAKLVQRWCKGDPWWRVAQRYQNGQLMGQAVLLEVNGQPVPQDADQAP